MIILFFFRETGLQHNRFSKPMEKFQQEDRGCGHHEAQGESASGVVQWTVAPGAHDHQVGLVANGCDESE